MLQIISVKQMKCSTMSCGKWEGYNNGIRL